MSKNDPYIPALGLHWLTPVYDPLQRWAMREERFKRNLVQQAHILGKQRVLDLGCGTGTLTILLKQLHPDAHVVGLDADAQVLAIARKKAADTGVTIVLEQGMATSLPYEDASFDRVLSSLVFHHLTSENKQQALHQVFRALQPGGELHIVDFGQPRDTYARLLAPIMQRFEEMSDNIKGLLPEMMRRAGFERVEELDYYRTIVGGLSLYKAEKPAVLSTIEPAALLVSA